MSVTPALKRLNAGEIDFDRFVNETRPDWERMSQSLFGRYVLPAGVSREDVEQEMLVEAWKASRKWDPKRGMALSKYVVWCCNAAAKRYINVQRNSPQRDSKRHGRFPTVGIEHDIGMGQANWAVDSPQEARAQAAEMLEVLVDQAPDEPIARALMVLISAIEQNDRASNRFVANLLWADPTHRVPCRLESLADASRLVEEAQQWARWIGEQLAGEEAGGQSRCVQSQADRDHAGQAGRLGNDQATNQHCGPDREAGGGGCRTVHQA